MVGAIHDRCSSYEQHTCAHYICAVHILRDCTYVYEQEQQDWAVEMHEALPDMHAAEQWRQHGSACVPFYERDEWVARYARDSGSWLCRATAYQRSGPETAWTAEAKCRQESIG